MRAQHPQHTITLYFIFCCCLLALMMLSPQMHHVELLQVPCAPEQHVQLMNASCASELHAPGALELHAASLVQMNETKKRRAAHEPLANCFNYPLAVEQLPLAQEPFPIWLRNVICFCEASLPPIWFQVVEAQRPSFCTFHHMHLFLIVVAVNHCSILQMLPHL